jgi:WD40 repeat protein
VRARPAEPVARFGRSHPPCGTLSVDGRRLTIGAKDGAISILDLTTDALTELPLRGCPVLSDNGQWLAIEGSAGVTIADARSGSVAWTTPEVQFLASFAGDVLIADVANDPRIHVVGRTGTMPLPIASEARWRDAFSRDGRWGFFAVGDTLGGSEAAFEIAMVDLSKGVEVRRWSIGPRPYELEASRDGAALAAASDGGVTVWDTTSMKRLADVHVSRAGSVTAFRFSDDGKHLAVAGFTSIRVVDLAGNETISMASGPSSPDQLRFSPDGQLVASFEGGGARWVRRWQIDTGTEIPPARPHLGYLEAAAWVDDRTVVVGGEDGVVRLWDVATQKEKSEWTLERSEPIHQLVAVAPGRIGVSSEYHAWVLEMTGHALTPVGEPRTHGYDVTWSSSGEWLATRRQQGASPVVLARGDTETSLAIETHRLLDVEAGRVVFLDDLGGLRVWDGAADEMTGFAQPYEVDAVAALSADGRLLAAGGYELRVWSVDDNRSSWTRHRDSRIAALAFSSNGDTLAVGLEGEIEVADASSGRSHAAWLGHWSHVTALAFSPDGQRLLSASSDGTAAIWSLPDGAIE